MIFIKIRKRVCDLYKDQLDLYKDPRIFINLDRGAPEQEQVEVEKRDSFFFSKMRAIMTDKWARLQLRPQKLYPLHIRGAVCRLQRAWGVPPQTPLRFSFSVQI